MHRTDSGEKRKNLKDEARELSRDARALQKDAVRPRLAGRQRGCKARRRRPWRRPRLKLQARLEDLTVWQMEKVKQSRKGSKT